MISAHDAVFVGWIIFIAGFAIGVHATLFWEAVHGDAKDLKHEETVIEQGKEIARLRAQVAGLIGKE